MASSNASRERRRCIEIVQEYRRELTSAYARKPDASNAQQVLTVIQRLQEMERRMLVGDKTDRSQLATPKTAMGEFSIEEMERAQEIIAEQEHNPFEG